MFQDSPSYNSWLTEYAQGSYADEADSIGRILFPPVKVSTRIGGFNKRDIDNAFRVYNTKLTRGNTPTRIDTNSAKGLFDVSPHALEVGTWRFDMDQDGGGSDEREDALQDLMSTQLITREYEAVTLWKKEVARTTGAGVWKGEAGANADPIDELDQLVHDRAGGGDAALVALDRELVPPQAQRAVQLLAQRVEHAVADARQLGGDVVRNEEHVLHRPAV